MKINLAEKILDRKGNPMPMGGGDSNVATVATVAVMAIDGCPDPNISREEKYRRGELADQIFDSQEGDIELDSKDVTLLKDLVAKSFPPMIVVRFCDLVDPKSK